MITYGAASRIYIISLMLQLADVFSNLKHQNYAKINHSHSMRPAQIYEREDLNVLGLPTGLVFFGAFGHSKWSR